MSKYEVVIKKISPKHNHGSRYEVRVYWDKDDDRGVVSWSYTLWGAHRVARQLIRKHEDIEPEPVIVEEYEL
jgi:hypothetical protein